MHLAEKILLPQPLTFGGDYPAALYRLDLRSTDLDGCDLSSGNFAGAIFWRSRLEAANLNDCDLSGAQMQRCLLNFVNFREAKMRGTMLNFCTLNQCSGHFDPFLGAAKLDAVCLVGADMTAVATLMDQLPKTFGSKDTKLSGLIQNDRDHLKNLSHEFRVAKREGNAARMLEIEAEQIASQIAHWSEYNADDLATNMNWKEFAKRNAISGWPFEN